MLYFHSPAEADDWVSRNKGFLKEQEQRVRRYFRVRGIRTELVRRGKPARIVGLDGRGKPILALELREPNITASSRG